MSVEIHFEIRVMFPLATYIFYAFFNISPLYTLAPFSKRTSNAFMQKGFSNNNNYIRRQQGTDEKQF